MAIFDSTARRQLPAEPTYRTPPHNIEAEQALLGGLLLDATAWENIADAVTREDFYRPDHQLIFEAIANLVGEGKPCDVVTVSQELERTGKLDGAGGLAYLSSVARDTPSAANVRAYADIVRERSLLRQLVRDGEIIGREPLEAVRARHREVMAELPSYALQLSRGYPAIPTLFSPNGA